MAATSHLVAGIAGGSGSGKITLSRELVKSLGSENVTYVSHDFYYRDLSRLSLDERVTVNFDYPDALETSLVVAHLTKLKARESVQMPLYAFCRIHKKEGVKKFIPTVLRCSARSCAARRVESKEMFIIFCRAALRDLIDVKVFLDTEPNLRFSSKMQRDFKDRNCTAENVVEEHLQMISPMHVLFVAPYKKFCDVAILDGLNSVILDMILAKLWPRIHSSVKIG